MAINPLRFSVAKTSLVIATTLLFAYNVRVFAGDSNRSAADLIQEAISKTNIFDLPSFEMKAHVQVLNQGKPLEGSYSLLWNGPDQWREEITFPGYSEIQVEQNGTVFLKRSTGFLPLRIYQLHVALGYGTLPSIDSFVRSEPRPGETIKKMRNRKVNDVEAECAEMITEEKIPREVCVDSATKTLVRREGFRDSGLAPVGPKLFPRFLSYQEQKTTLAEVHVMELQAGDKNPASMFEPPPGAASKSGCMNPVPGRLTVKVAPKYPESDKLGHVQGTVSVYTLIGIDGIPRNVKVVYGVSPTLDESSLTAVQQWRYEPATCDGKPVETETVIAVHYTLGG